MKAHVVFSIFRRNFVAYFSNPTGYVFLCVFVLLSGFAAFWPHEFWANNLASLDQLNKYLPYILLVFIPAITMGIWAEERRLGTDELLLTIPASDLEVVLGKFLAAVAIYSVSLLFSMVCNLLVLVGLGSPDLGLFFGIYFGYWLVGVAMLAVGMVGSFLTSNMTIAFILGALFNAPLVFLDKADLVFSGPPAVALKRWSIGAQFADLGRGVLSLSSLAYFLGIAAVSLYLCVVLIGRRHWRGGPDSPPLGWHYLQRTLALVVSAASVVVLLSYTGMRLDVTSERINSLSEDTIRLLRELNPPRPVRIRAFLTPQVPESFVQTRLNILNILEEFRARAPEKVRVEIIDTPLNSEEALQAEELYGIQPEEVYVIERGMYLQEQIILGVVFECGLEKVVVPFIGRGTPVEYELIRSLATVARESGKPRKTIAVVRTDAPLDARFDPRTMSSSREERILAELKKQYRIERVSLDTPLSKRYDVLLAIQPSSLGPQQMKNFIAAVRSGQPTAIFEDPCPYYIQAPATSAPRRPPMSNPFMPSPAQPKGDIESLWAMLGVNFHGDEVVWQDYNPYPKLQRELSVEWVFLREGEAMPDPFAQNCPITSGLQELLLPFPGHMTRARKDTGVRFKPLVRTGTKTGIIKYRDLRSPFSPNFVPEAQRRQKRRIERERYVLAAELRGRLKEDLQLHPGDEKDGKPQEEGANEQQQDKGESSQQKEIHVVLVADIDCLSSLFYLLQQEKNNPFVGVDFRFQNVAFVHNMIDYLAGDHRFLEVRKRQFRYRTLETIESLLAKHRSDVEEEIQQLLTRLENERKNSEQRINQEVQRILKQKGIDQREFQQQLQIVMENVNRQFQARIQRMRRETDRKIRHLQLQLNQREAAVQRRFKFMAVAIPPIFPLLMGVVVFINRLAREKEGVSRKRLRQS